MSIYKDMVQAGIETDHHCSDLYVPDCPESRAILANHGKQVDGWNVQPFISQIDGKQWLDIPFNYGGMS
jgi:hypothetical protein